ncbi:MAG: sulfate adenylyltransferase subunit CysD [Spirochaetaceae bacterium]|jgi:sulfate adenylyltransferase subunit 2|nr:sulfate adenylyltransferase subunit CysD [Spirochaetaceae bacterium]
MKHYSLNHLKQLENEAIYVLREVAAQFEKPVMLFSGGKDSICMAWLARKAFSPGKIPFPMLHVDTGHNFDETISFRDKFLEEIGANLIVRTVQESIDKGRVAEETGNRASRNGLQTITLLDALKEFKFTCAMGGARRDEEKARAKERFFSFRDSFGQWDPKNQRPELWNLFNAQHNMGEHFRAFPISNWTELDVWQYIAMEKVPMPSLYFSHQREIIQRDGVVLAHIPGITDPQEDEVVETRDVRCRTIGDITCTGLSLSPAKTIKDIVNEVACTRTTERGGRADDKRSEAAMEDRKKQGYF